MGSQELATGSGEVQHKVS